MRSECSTTGGSGEASGFLRRLARDRRGNTMAMMAVFLFPLSALAGSAVDTGRLYLVKIRLQQACDAGALAGRKFMIDSDNTALDSNAVTQAKVFFAQNFPSGLIGTPTYTATDNPYPFVPTKTADKQVAATATMQVPMTIMKMFGQPTRTVTVACEARFDIADTDIIFVLDTTGSMACKPERTDAECRDYLGGKDITYTNPSTSDGMPGYAGTTGYSYTEETSGSTNISRIQAVRTAVTSFYSTIAANVDSSTHIRYGFVTYSSMVNAGKAITDVSPSYIIGGSGSGSTTWTYQSRRKTGEYVASTGYAETSFNQTQCSRLATIRTPAATSSDPYPFDTSTGSATRVSYFWATYRKNGQNVTGCIKQTDKLGPQWTYQPVSYDVSSFVGGNAVTDPSQVDGATSRWLGCIEERKTTPGITSFNNDSLPADLDPNLTPSNDDSRWRPLWPDVEYFRPTYNDYPTSDGDNNRDFPSYGLASQLAGGATACGKPVQRLKVMSASDVSAYVNAADFKPVGGTYHDVGMIWGTRLLSPKGIFAADTAAWAGRPAPKRVIVFLTDGVMSPSDDIYGLYGVESLDRRVSGGSGTLKDYHNARFLAECTKAKSLGVEVWTVAIAAAADPQLTSCASGSAKALYTTSGSQLDTYFKQIAQQVALLRVSK